MFTAGEEFAHQGIGRGPVAGLGEGGGLPPVNGMTGRAFPTVVAVDELAFVLILVAIHALVVRHRGLEVRLLMALIAGHAIMFAEQRKLGLAVIEGAVRDFHAMPAVSVVAGFAARGEGAAMGVLMATGTRREIQALILKDLGIGLAGFVALGAFEGVVLAGEREFGGRVVEGFDRLPLR